MRDLGYFVEKEDAVLEEGSAVSSYPHYFDPTSDPHPLSLADAGRQLGVRGETLRSCARDGRRGRDGTTYYLEICRLPCGIGTSVAAYQRFLRQLNANGQEAKAP